MLAVVSIRDAARAGVSTNKIAKILKEVTQGDRYAAAHRPVDAIEDYCRAWTMVGKLHPVGIESTAGGLVRMRFLGTFGKVYRVQASSNLVDWQTVGTCTADSEGEVQFTDPAAARHPNRFYRLVPK